MNVGSKPLPHFGFLWGAYQPATASGVLVVLASNRRPVPARANVWIA